jgi:hypothetical protein
VLTRESWPANTIRPFRAWLSPPGSALGFAHLEL